MLKKLWLLMPFVLLTFSACGGGDDEVKVDSDDGGEVEVAEKVEETVDSDEAMVFTTFTDEEAGFRIDFPGEPEIFDENIPLGDDLEDLVMKTYMYEVSASEVFFVSYIDYDPTWIEASDPQELLQAGKEGGLGELGESEIIEEEEIEIDGNPGLYVKAKAEDAFGSYYGVYHFYLVDSRLYQIIMMTDSEFHSEEQIDGFARSFELL